MPVIVQLRLIRPPSDRQGGRRSGGQCFLGKRSGLPGNFQKNPGAQNKHLPILLDRFKTATAVWD